MDDVRRTMCHVTTPSAGRSAMRVGCACGSGRGCGCGLPCPGCIASGGWSRPHSSRLDRPTLGLLPLAAERSGCPAAGGSGSGRGRTRGRVTWGLLC
ncbi:unnamed protein product [Diplocarpon coronariae]|nr:hypothetical protein JHW43_005025 [Diplocarpon mali]